MFKITDTLVHLIIILALLVLSGLLALTVVYVWDRVFTGIVTMLQVKKDFIQFMYDKHHNQKITRSKME